MVKTIQAISTEGKIYEGHKCTVQKFDKTYTRCNRVAQFLKAFILTILSAGFA